MKGHLSEVGYDQHTHDEMLKGIAAKDLPGIIVALVEVYERLYDQSAYEINCGNCEEFAADVIALYGQGELVWHDNMPDCTPEESDWWAHCFVMVDGRFYDSQTPDGVDHWRELPCFANNPPDTAE